MKTNVQIFSDPKLWMESNAIQQLQSIARLPDVKFAIGLPDLHAGKHCPPGGVVITGSTFYPHFLGNDVGCGFCVNETDLPVHKMRLDKQVKLLQEFEGHRAKSFDWGALAPHCENGMSTLGAGNHFSEVSRLEVLNEKLALAHGLNPENMYIITHSGSRGLGTEVLEHFAKIAVEANVAETHNAGRTYLEEHAYALSWARMNRRELSRQLARCLHIRIEKELFNNPHNFLEKHVHGSQSFWIHRKGANSSLHGLGLIAGTRGTYSYLVEPNTAIDKSCYSYSHGSGRKWQRGEVRERLRAKEIHHTQLTHTELGGRVVCAQRDLLFEESPLAYKDIEDVLRVHVDNNLVTPVARLVPLINFKTNLPQERYQK